MKCDRSRHSEATLPCWHQAWHDCCVLSGSGTLSDVSIHGDFCTFIEILLGFQRLIDISFSGQSLNFVNPRGRGAGLLSLPSSSMMSYMRKWTRVPQIWIFLFFPTHTHSSRHEFNPNNDLGMPLCKPLAFSLLSQST